MALFIDSHIHLGCVGKFYFFNTTISTLIEKMDLLGISFCINTHSEGLMTNNIEKGIIKSIKAYEESDGRIFSYFVFNPYKSQECINLMERYKKEKAFKGIKIHPSFHEIFADDPLYEDIWQYASDRCLPIMSHTWDVSSHNDTQKYSYPKNFEKYINMFPKVTFICGHSGGRYNGIIEASKMAAKYKNVYLDTSGDIYYLHLIEFLVKTSGANKILFGSDAFWFDQATQLGLILSANISLEDKEKILFKNANNIFRLVDDLGGIM
jgi:predicted TIM-barrel fold metal-dependent hydrolase